MPQSRKPGIILRKGGRKTGDEPPEQPTGALQRPEPPERQPTPEQLEQIRILEHELAFEEDTGTGRALVGAKLDARRQELRQLARDSGYTERTADFFDGVHLIGLAQGMFESSLQHLERTAARIEKLVMAMDRTELREALLTSQHRKNLDETELLTLRKLDAACAEWWRTQRLGRSRNIQLTALNAKLLRNDLLTRRANRLADDEERRAEQVRVSEELKSLIEEIESPGVRAEYQLMWLLRKWARDKRLDHLFDVVHTRPAQDLNDVAPVDAYLTIGTERIRLNIKSLSGGGYVQEYNEDLVQRGRASASIASAEPVEFHFEDLRDLFAIEASLPNAPSRRRRASLRRSIIASLTDGSRTGHVFPQIMREQLPRLIA